MGIIFVRRCSPYLYEENAMKFSKMQIVGFGYLTNVFKIGGKTTIVIHLDFHKNETEDVWLHCTACKNINDYIERELSYDLKKGNAIKLKFCANYKSFSEVFNELDKSDERIVIFNADLKAIDAVYVNNALKTVN